MDRYHSSERGMWCSCGLLRGSRRCTDAHGHDFAFHVVPFANSWHLVTSIGRARGLRTCTGVPTVDL